MKTALVHRPQTKVLSNTSCCFDKLKSKGHFFNFTKIKNFLNNTSSKEMQSNYYEEYNNFQFGKLSFWNELQC